MDFIEELKKRRWQMSMIALLTLGLITNGYGTALAETMADISGGSVAADGSWHGNSGKGKVVKITAGNSFTNDADIYSSKDYSMALSLQMDGGKIGGNIYGGWSENNRVSNNRTEISGGTIFGNVYGGWANKEWANGNLVEIANDVVVGIHPTDAGNVFGGYSVENEASHNIVNSYGYVAHNIYGGYGKISSNENKLTLGDGCKTQRVYGGYSKTGSANKNEVTIYDNVILDEVYGGYGKGSANDNVVYVENVTAESASYIPLVGGLANDTEKGMANYNKVTLINTNGNFVVSGGKSLNSTIHSANNNEVTIENSRINTAFAANRADETDSNKLNITNSVFTGALTGVSSLKEACSNILTVDGISFEKTNKEWIAGVEAIEGQKINDNAMYINNAKAFKISMVEKRLDSDGESRLGLSAEGNKAVVNNSRISNL